MEGEAWQRLQHDLRLDIEESKGRGMDGLDVRPPNLGRCAATVPGEASDVDEASTLLAALGPVPAQVACTESRRSSRSQHLLHELSMRASILCVLVSTLEHFCSELSIFSSCATSVLFAFPSFLRVAAMSCLNSSCVMWMLLLPVLLATLWRSRQLGLAPELQLGQPGPKWRQTTHRLCLGSRNWVRPAGGPDT